MNALTKWFPESRELFPRSDFFGRVFDEFDSFFENEKLTPKLEIKENDSSLILKAELPGMTKDDISVELKDSILTISGEKKIEKEDKNEKYHRTEISYGKFSRSFHVPMNVDSENIQANFKDGILNIEIPKAESEKTKQITIS